MSATVSTVDLTRVAFSVRGCWLSLLVFSDDRSTVGDDLSRYHGFDSPSGPLGPGLYLRSNHARGVTRRELMRIRPIVDGREVSGTARVGDDGAAVDVLHEGKIVLMISLSSPGRAVIATFGCGVEVEAVPHHHASAFPDGTNDAWIVNLRHAIRRYRVRAVRGSGALEQTMESTDTAVLAKRIRIAVNSRNVDDSILPTCIVSVDEHWSAWNGESAIGGVSETRAEVAKSFDGFASAFPETTNGDRDTARLAHWILWSRTQSPAGRLAREAVFMDLGTMDQIWSWDNLFNLAALAAGHPLLAWDQLAVFADHQDENGAYPDGMNDMFYHFNFAKPPVHGVILSWIEERNPDFLQGERLRAAYQTVSRFADFWLTHRRDVQSGLPYYIHGNETQDNSTFFDGALPIVTPDLPTYLVGTLEWLAKTAASIGSETGEADRWRREADRISADLIEHLWDGEHFVARCVSDGTTVRADSVLRVAPLLIAYRLPGHIVRALVSDIEGFITEHGLATERPDSPLYREDSYWRGPIWAPTTFLMVRALEVTGALEAARDLADRFCRTCERAGFAENFGALTGEGFRDAGYTWTASVYLWLLA